MLAPPPLLRIAVLALGLCLGARAQAEDERIAALLASVRARGAFAAEFVEEKQLAVLAAPLRSRGEVEFAPPSRLRWEVREPVASVLRVDGERVEISQPGAPTRRLDLATEPAVRALVESIRLFLTGDLAELHAAYEVAYRAHEAGWHVSLAPRAPALRRFVVSIELAGSGDALRELALRYANGDGSRVAFEAPR